MLPHSIGASTRPSEVGHQLGGGEIILFNRAVAVLEPTVYRVAPAISARLLGAAIVVLGILVLIVTLVVVLVSAPLTILWAVALVGVLGIGLGALYLTRWMYVVRLTDAGYQVRFVRGAGVMQGRWPDVEDAVSANVSGATCLVLRLRDGRSTVIPVAALAGNRDDFANDVRQRLARGHGLRPLTAP